MSSLEKVYQEIIDGINSDNIDRDNLEQKKKEVCGKYNASKVPKNSEILNYADNRKSVKNVLRKSPIRSSSGVVPVSIMTHPVTSCPHGRCLFCPAGKGSKFENSQLSYPGGPTVRRAKRNQYDPYRQVQERLNRLYKNGHDIDKTELIIKSSTITSRSHDYQVYFVKRALEAMNDFYKSKRNKNSTEIGESPEFKYIEDVIKKNETADVKCVGITFETKPDWCGEEQIDRMLSLGVTKTEIGVQTTYDNINERMNRGHGIQESINANKKLRDSGMKVGFHMMPGLPGMDENMILNDFERIFNNSNLRPDYLKIYPALVIEGTALYDMWKKGNYEPLTTEQAKKLISKIKTKLPEYTRLQRVQRDIPANQITAGVKKSNLRQLAKQNMNEKEKCNCIRCRETGLTDEKIKPENIELDVITYTACEGTEKFISYKDTNTDQLIGFLRLRFPNNPHRKELKESSIIRELHIYGQQESIGQNNKEKWQHKGYGKKLVKKAEEISKQNEYNQINIISGIGVRNYYKQKLNYSQNGPYVAKNLN